MGDRIIRKSLALSITILLTLVIRLPVTGSAQDNTPEIEARLREAGANELAGMWGANRRLKLAELEGIYEDVEREMPLSKARFGAGPKILLGERTGRRRRCSTAGFSPRQPSRCVACVDHRHVGDRVVWSGKHMFAPQDGSGECPQLTGIGGRLPRHVFDRAASV